jgi:restriction system protein
MKRLWVVRAGKSGEREQQVLEEGLLMPGFSDIADLSKCGDRAAIDKLVAQAHPNETSKMRLSVWTGQLNMLRHVMTEGDLVVLSRKTVPQIAIGNVVGPYDFLPTKPAPHARRVEWLRKEAPRQVFAQDLLHSFGSFLTICEITRNRAVERILVVLKSGTDPGPVVASTPAAPAAADTTIDDISAPQDLDTLARDQIRAHVAAYFAGHRFTRLIKALLDAEGYRTNMSPEGADNGIDIVAGKGALGFDPPRLVVQCKSGNTVCDLPTLNALVGSVHGLGADHGLLVSWGRFTTSVQKQINAQFFKIRLWDSDAVLDAVFRTYERLPEELRKEPPLTRTWTLVLGGEETG